MTDLTAAMREKYGTALDEMTASQYSDALKRTIRSLELQTDHQQAIRRGAEEIRRAARAVKGTE